MTHHLTTETPTPEPKHGRAGARAAATDRTRALVLVLVVVTLSSLVAAPAAAAAETRGWQLRVYGANVDPDLTFIETTDSGDPVRVVSDSAIGFGLGLEYRFNRRTGLELAYLTADPELVLTVEIAEADLVISDRDKVSFAPLTLALPIHLTPDRRVDVYLAPLLAQVRYGDFRFDLVYEGVVADSIAVRSKNDFAWGGKLGLDLGFGDGSWSINAAVTFLDTTLEVTDDDGDPAKLDFDPLIIAAGFGYRF